MKLDSFMLNNNREEFFLAMKPREKLQKRLTCLLLLVLMLRYCRGSHAPVLVLAVILSIFELQESVGRPWGPLNFVQTCRWEDPDSFIESINCSLSPSYCSLVALS
jgi:hypothetical protein